MSPELERYLDKQGVKLLAAQQVIKLLVGMFALIERDLLDANLRAWRIRMQELAGKGEPNDALEMAVELLEEALAWSVTQPNVIRPAK